MPNPEIVPNVETVYTLFATLSSLAKQKFDNELGGKLLLYGQLDADGSAVALAGNIAGAATLGVDPDPERLKQGIRHGFCDFMVNNLDEALRILKNELRKRQPVSVCLEADLAATLLEAVERGLQPDILAAKLTGPEIVILVERGATQLDTGKISLGPDSEAVHWSAATAPALWLPKVDALAAETLPPNDPRRRWLKLAPRYLGRTLAGSRYLQMGREELDRFRALVAESESTGAIGAKISITP